MEVAERVDANGDILVALEDQAVLDALAALDQSGVQAVAVALLTPAKENDSTLYLMLCGVVAMASMIIPGLSGSFVRLLMGNYSLVMIDSVVQSFSNKGSSSLSR